MFKHYYCAVLINNGLIVIYKEKEKMRIPKTIYNHIFENKLKTLLLFFLFPILICVIVYGFLFLCSNLILSKHVINNLTVFWVVLFTCSLSWMFFAFFFGDKILLMIENAQEISDSLDPMHSRARYTVKNIAMAGRIPTPSLYLIQDDSINTFSTGRTPKNAGIVITSGTLTHLSPIEFKAVVAHEIAHIANHDTLLNTMMITGVGIFNILSNIIFKISLKRIFIIKIILTAISVLLLTFNLLIFSIIRFFIFRTQEFIADTTGTLITRTPSALADALEKIKYNNAQIKMTDKKYNALLAYIFNPINKTTLFSKLSDTHPPISTRISKLRNMSSQTLSLNGILPEQILLY